MQKTACAEVKKKNIELLYPEISYRIIGILFDVYNQMGYGYKEISYERAVAVKFKSCGLSFKRQLYAPLVFEGTTIGKNYFDFVVENKIVVELKRGDRFSKTHIDQLNQYLKVNGLKLGILAYFNPRGLIFKRIVNIL